MFPLGSPSAGTARKAGLSPQSEAAGLSVSPRGLTEVPCNPPPPPASAPAVPTQDRGTRKPLIEARSSRPVCTLPGYSVSPGQSLHTLCPCSSPYGTIGALGVPARGPVRGSGAETPLRIFFLCCRGDYKLCRGLPECFPQALPSLHGTIGAAPLSRRIQNTPVTKQHKLSVDIIP
jgi:hypothetical protein